MIDIVGAIVLTAVAFAATGTVIFESPVSTLTARRLAVGTGAWFAVITALAAAGLFSTASGVGTPAIGLAVLVPVVALALASIRGSTLRRLALGVPLVTLVGVHVTRLVGAYFVLLWAQGRLPVTFATSAGWGDVTVALLAVPIALAVRRRLPGWWGLTLAWNTLGLLDLIVAVALGAGSAASPLRFIHESPESGATGTLPWLLIPGFLVPFYILTHLAVFAQLAAAGRAPRGR
jgi:hypothetical protein